MMDETNNFSIAQNVLWNINTTRYVFYNKLLKESENSLIICKDRIIQLAIEAGFSYRMAMEELIGCLYANFINKIDDLETYKITERAIRDFRLYVDDSKYKFCELPITLDFTNTYIRLLTKPVDSLSNTKKNMLVEKKWSLNKSRITLIKKVKELSDVGNEIGQIIPFICTQEFCDTQDLIEVLEKCGRKRKIQGDYTANLNFRGVYSSNTIMNYYDMYLTVAKYVKKPIDWGG